MKLKNLVGINTVQKNAKTNLSLKELRKYAQILLATKKCIV